ncbi:hypothetical protein MRB53_037092 [Persea americana]|nr:hypothetical protein MRB53_037092 [Persea americana]
MFHSSADIPPSLSAENVAALLLCAISLRSVWTCCCPVRYNPGTGCSKSCAEVEVAVVGECRACSNVRLLVSMLLKARNRCIDHARRRCRKHKLDACSCKLGECAVCGVLFDAAITITRPDCCDVEEAVVTACGVCCGGGGARAASRTAGSRCAIVAAQSALKL